MTTLDALNKLPAADALDAFSLCCGARAWAIEMVRRRPYASKQVLLETADAVWSSLSPEDWREAFTHHPKIGDIDDLRAKFSSTSAWAEGEQSSVNEANEAVLQRLAQGNAVYEVKFGFIFIVCATGKSAAEMADLLESRLPNDPDTELAIAAEEQRKITRIRLEKLMP
ncbi:MAG: 2-oxo-4-hydroxy-4-carboxy-5-ureidoimidazoline decarboxylase [Bradymonadaceae bacterium]|nr:2-oxo-4-hydroxy-4-carboxy-5-ureidoimidazoline decarboxylase [Lujinxingiaceae bacterium]